MIYYDNIPLSEFLYTNPYAYYYMELFTHAASDITVATNPITNPTYQTNARPLVVSWNYIELPRSEEKEWCKALKIDTRTFNAMRGKTVLNFEADFIVALPFSVWQEVSKELVELPIGNRKTITRVFLYFYFWAMRFQGSYSHSRANIAQILHIQKNNLANAIRWLEEKGLLVRSDYSKADGYSRRYYIPEELWNNQCKKEWNNLQKTLEKSKS